MGKRIAQGPAVMDDLAVENLVVPRNNALRVLSQGVQMVYAIRTRDGLVKIGCTGNLEQRVRHVHGEVLAFRPGDFADEKAIHDGLVPHRAKGHEFYHPTPEVLAVVNELREHFNLPPIAA